MISALVYLQTRSLANRLRLQLGRLKRPQYLLGALVGGAYFGFFFLRPFLSPSAGTPAVPAALESAPGAGRSLLETGAAFGLFLLVVSGWLFPKARAALDFTEAEVAFLFPAPLTRRMLIHFKLLRSQLRILLSALFLSLLTTGFASAGQAGMRLVGWWLMMCTLELHLLGVSFTRTRWLDRGLGHGRRRLGVAVVLATLAAGVGVWAWRSLPDLSFEALTDPGRVADYARQVATSGPVPWILLPFRLLLRPMLTPDLGRFVVALAPATVLLLLNYVWVLRSDVSFEEATLEHAREKARAIAAVRSGNWHLARAKHRPIRAPFPLGPAGPRVVAVFWKNLIAATSTLSLRFWGWAAVIALIAAATMRAISPDLVLLRVVGGVSLGLMPALSLWGTQMLAFDFRQDLPQADLLKTYPLRGWQLVLGEILAPVALLTGVQWILLALAATSFSAPRSGLPAPLADLLGWGLGLGLLVPALNANSLLLMNAGVLLFPAWVRIGPGRAEGFEAMGQRMVFMLAQLVGLLLLLLLPAAVFAGLYLAGRLWLPVLVLAPLAAGAATLVLAAEAVAGLLVLGSLFERLDLSDEPPGG